MTLSKESMRTVITRHLDRVEHIIYSPEFTNVPESLRKTLRDDQRKQREKLEALR